MTLKLSWFITILFKYLLFFKRMGFVQDFWNLEPCHTKNIIYVPAVKIENNPERPKIISCHLYLHSFKNPDFMLLQNFTLLRDINVSPNSNQTFSCCLCPSLLIPSTMDIIVNRLCSFSACTLLLRETQQLMKALLLAKLIAHELHFLEHKGSSYYHYTSTTIMLLRQLYMATICHILWQLLRL